MEEQKSNRSNSSNQNQNPPPNQAVNQSQSSTQSSEQQMKVKKEAQTVQTQQVIDTLKYKSFIEEVKAKNLNSTEMLSASVMNTIHIEDSIIYNPKNIHILNTKFPVYPLALNQKILDKFNDDTLFFMFFVQDETEKKVIAFNELIKRNWIYNTKFHTFFQLVGEPKEKNDKYIEGRFKFFDHEKDWVVKLKKDWKFENEHLLKKIAQ
ncbi:MAG: hypothetical protein MJ252_03105 [archaeon]|nr:hypothetical protein [archaeon]